MPLKLVPPAPGRSPFYRVRGTHCGRYVDRSTGLADERKARAVLRKWQDDIERGQLEPARPLTFAAAALSYVQATGERRFLKPIIDWFGPQRPLADIDQAAIDDAAVKLYPDASPATRNRQVYTPISAILKHAGVSAELRRPKGAEGRTKTGWLTPDQAARVISLSSDMDAEYGALWTTLVYTGLRLSEALYGLRCDDVSLSEATAYVGRTKTGEPRLVHLPPPVVAALASLPRDMDRPGETVFRFRKNGALYLMLARLRMLSGIDGLDYHMARHTYATWMRRYAGLDVHGLVGTGAWASAKSAARYAHVVVTEEARRADALPDVTRAKPVRKARK